MAQSTHIGYRRIQKGIGCVVCLFLFVCALVSAAPVAKADVVQAAAGTSAAVVMEATTGRVLYQNNAYVPKPMASTTKILTAITAIEHLAFDKTVSISPQAAGIEGSSIYLKAGEQWRVEDLLYGLMLRSGNDAACQLALSTAGSIQAFAALMNDTAYRAGAYRSHFCNPHGLHEDNHYTTAYDLACITAYSMRNPLFCQIVATRTHRYSVGGEQRVFVNKNKMLQGYEGAIGVKTGYTKVAGRCLVTAAERDGMRLIAVVLNEYDMWYRSAELLDNAFAEYTLRDVWTAGDVKTATLRGTPTPVTVRHTYRYPLSAAEMDRLQYDFSLSGRRSNDPCLGEVVVRLDNRVLFRDKVYLSL